MLCRVACLYKLGKDKEAISILANALVENYNKHEFLFNYIPELVNNSTYSSVIKYYKGA